MLHWRQLQENGSCNHCPPLIPPCCWILQKENREVEPHAQFLLDLLVLLSQWKAEGKYLVVCLYANKDIYKRALWKARTNPNRLNLQESFQVHTTQQLRATYFRGSKAIDSISVLDDISSRGPCMIVLNIHSTSMVGTHPQPIAWETTSLASSTWQTNSRPPHK